MFTDQEKKEKIKGFIRKIADVPPEGSFSEELDLDLEPLKFICYNVMQVNGYTPSEFRQIIDSLDSENLDEFGKVSQQIIDAVNDRKLAFVAPQAKLNSRFLTPDEITQNVFLPFLNSKIIDSKELSDKKDQIKEMLLNLKVVANTGEEAYDLKGHVLTLYEEVLTVPETLLFALQEIKTRAAEKLVDTQKEEIKFGKFTGPTNYKINEKPSQTPTIFEKGDNKKSKLVKKM